MPAPVASPVSTAFSPYGREGGSQTEAKERMESPRSGGKPFIVSKVGREAGHVASEFPVAGRNS